MRLINKLIKTCSNIFEETLNEYISSIIKQKLNKKNINLNINENDNENNFSLNLEKDTSIIIPEKPSIKLVFDNITDLVNSFQDADSELPLFAIHAKNNLELIEKYIETTYPSNSSNLIFLLGVSIAFNNIITNITTSDQCILANNMFYNIKNSIKLIINKIPIKKDTNQSVNYIILSLLTLAINYLYAANNFIISRNYDVAAYAASAASVCIYNADVSSSVSYAVINLLTDSKISKEIINSTYQQLLIVINNISATDNLDNSILNISNNIKNSLNTKTNTTIINKAINIATSEFKANNKLFTYLDKSNINNEIKNVSKNIFETYIYKEISINNIRIATEKLFIAFNNLNDINKNNKKIILTNSLNLKLTKYFNKFNLYSTQIMPNDYLQYLLISIATILSQNPEISLNPDSINLNL